jgi:hypothetical protein
MEKTPRPCPASKASLVVESVVYDPFVNKGANVIAIVSLPCSGRCTPAGTGRSCGSRREHRDRAACAIGFRATGGRTVAHVRAPRCSICRCGAGPYARPARQWCRRPESGRRDGELRGTGGRDNRDEAKHGEQAAHGIRSINVMASPAGNGQTWSMQTPRAHRGVPSSPRRCRIHHVTGHAAPAHATLSKACLVERSANRRVYRRTSHHRDIGAKAISNYLVRVLDCCCTIAGPGTS